jgi:hypothetical protein
VPGHEGIFGNETADQLAKMGSEHPFIGPEPACGISFGVAKKVVRTQKGKGTHTRALCQKNEGSVKIKQRPVKMGSRTTYRTLSPKRAPFQIGIN